MNGIAEILKKYGTGLAETRKLMPELVESIERERAVRPPTLPTTPQFFTAEEVRGMGLVTEIGEPFELELGWRLKVTPPVNGQEPMVSYITPEDWEITQDQMYISPEGERFTREQMEMRLAAPEVPLEIKQVFGEVFPEWDIRDVEELLTSMAVSEDMPVPERVRAEGVQSEFLASIREIGRREDTEGLLKTMFPEVTPEQLEEFFAPVAAPPVVAPEVEIARVSAENIRINAKAVFPEYETNLDEFLSWGAQNPEAFKQKVKDAGPSKSSEALLHLISPSPRAQPWYIFGKVGANFTAGVGDLFTTTSGFLEWLDAPENIVTQSRAFGEFLQSAYIPPADPKDFTWRSMLDPEWWATSFTRAVPFTLALIPGAILAAHGGVAVATAAGLGRFLTIVAGSLAATGVMRPMESAFEAGGVYNEQIARGLSEEEADRAANETFWENMKLAGVDAAQLITAFFPIKGGGAAVNQVLKRRIVAGGAKVVGVGIMEAGEEAYQEVVQRRAMGDPLDFDPQMKEATAIGFIFGAGLGGAGSVWETLTGRVKKDMTPEMLADFNGTVKAELAKGATPEQAELTAFDKIAETPEGRASIEGTINDLKNIVREAEPVLEADPPVLMTIPDSEKIIDTVMADNWMRTMLQKVAKVPSARKLIEWGLGKRILVNRQSEAVEDIVGRGKFLHTEISRRAEGSEALIYWRLAEIERNPIKLFGFGKNAYSSEMFNRLLPEYKEVAEAGTLEHIFTHPEMYKLNDKQLQYVTRVHKINTLILNMLKEEGVAPENVGNDWWVHRVVQGKYDPNGELTKVRGRPGVKRGRIGAKVGFEMHRKAPTMADGIAWGIQYGRDPSEYVSTYAAEAFKKIADARFEKYMAKELEPLAQMGVLPKEELLRKYPEVVEKAIITAEELADTNSFSDKINRAIRGEKLPEQTLRAIERRFPDLGRKFRALVEEPAIADKQLRETITRNERLIRQLKARIEKAEAIDIEAIKAEARSEAIRIGIPDEQKLTEAFRLMDYEDRLAFRSTMDTQLDDIGRMVYEQGEELAGLMESFATEPASTLINLAKKVGWYKGEVPNLTLKQYRALTGKREILPNILTKDKKHVRWEYAFDEVATEMGYADGDTLKYAIEKALENKQAIDDLKFLNKMGQDRANGIKRMLGILDKVDTKPEFIPVTEPGMAAVPIPEAVPEVMTIEQFKETLGKVVAETQAEIKSTRKWLTEQRRQKAAKIPIDERLFAEEQARVAALEDRLPTLSEMAAKPEEYFGRLESEFPRIYELLLDRGRALKIIPAKLPAIPKAEPGMPEAGLQQDIFGYQTPVFPKGKGIVTQISMDDYNRLVELHKKEGLPPPNVVIKPKIEGVKGMEAETQIAEVTYEVPAMKSVKERKAALETLRREVKALAEARRAPFWEARAERAFRMEQIRQPGIDEGYIMHPFAGGRMFDQEFIDAFNKFFGHDAGLSVLKPTADTAGILRILKAALDWSQPAIQGTLSWGLAHSYLMTNPKVGVKLMGAWYKTFFEQIGAFFNPGIAASFMEANHEAISRRIAAGGSARAVFFFQEMQAVVGKGKIARMAETALRHIPLTPYQRAEVSFFAGGEIVRDRFWQVFEEKARAKGEDGQLARFLDILTGIADPRAMGVPLTVRQMEQSWIFFSSAYTRSYLTMVAEIFRGGMTGAKARRAVAGFIVAGAAYFTAIQYAISTLMGEDDDEAWEDVQRGFGLVQDPITGDWDWRPTAAMMSFKIGDNYFGIGGGIYGLMRLAGNIAATVAEVGERERIDLVRIMKHGSLNKRDNPFISWWYARSSALFSPIYEMATHRNFLGYPIETPEQYARYIISLLEPIWVEQSINPLIPGMAGDREVPENALETTAWITGELFGLRVNPEYAWQRFYNKANEFIPNIPEEQLDAKQRQAIAEGRKLDWGSLTKIQKINLLYRYPELREVYEEAQADSDLRAQPHWKQWEGRQEEERTTYYDRGNSLVDRVITGELDTRELREMWGEAGQNYGIALDMIEKEPAYQEIYNFFDRNREKGDKYLFEADMALAEYIDIMFTEYVDEKGDIDWDAKDRAVDAYIEKWGEEYYDIIREMYGKKRLLEDLSPALARLSDDKDKLGRGYWRLPYKPIKEMDEEDQAEGNIPAEYFALWKQYQALETDADREAFIEANPLLAKDWRAEYRKENPEHDASLALWGYGGKLQSREAYDLVLQWGRELGIPLEQMGLGLPPRSLIDDYFEHADIVRNTSGGSVEVRLYKLEHPEWLDWGVENWGWGDLSGDNINALRLRVEHKDLFAQYEGYGVRHSELYIEDDKAREKARDKLLEANPIFRDDRRRVEAYQLEFPDDQIESYVEYSNLLAKGFEQERYLLEHPDFYKSMIDLKDMVPFDPGYKVPAVQYDQIYHQWEDLFEQYETVTGTVSQRKAAREKILTANPEFAFDRQRREAYGKFVPEHLVDTYAEWFTTKPQRADDPWFEDHPTETYYGDDWWLMDRMEFYDTMVAMELWEERDFSKVPTKAVFALYKTYVGIPKGAPQLNFRARHPELDAWGVLAKGWKPIEERGKKEPPKTPWEEAEEAKRFKELFPFGSQSSEEFGQSEESTEEGMTTADWKSEYAQGTPHWATDMEPSVFAKEFVGTMESNKAKSVLEIGCGNGRDSILFTKSGLDVTSIDITPKAVELATKNAQKSKADINFKVANAEKLPFEDEEFDAVFTLSVLHATELKESLPELYRVLRPDGVAFIHIYADTQFKSGKEPEGIINYDDYLADIKGLGFEILKSYKEQEKEFDEFGEKHSIFVVSLKKVGRR